MTASDGVVIGVYGAANYGSMAGSHLNEPVVGIAATPDGQGYWLVAADGGVFAFGDATGPGMTYQLSSENPPVVGAAAAPISETGGHCGPAIGSARRARRARRARWPGR